MCGVSQTLSARRHDARSTAGVLLRTSSCTPPYARSSSRSRHEAHAVAMAALGPIEHVAPLRAMVRALLAPADPRLAVRALGLTFASPLGLAGGFDKNAHRARALGALGFGFLELGTVTAQPQQPNPGPNLFRLPDDRALVNRLGFPNEGGGRPSALGGRRERRLRGAGVPLGVSIGKSRGCRSNLSRGRSRTMSRASARRRASRDFVVVNVSSPNTKDLRAMQGAEIARALFAEIARAKRDAGLPVPVLVKIAPDPSDAGDRVPPRRRRRSEARRYRRDEHDRLARGAAHRGGEGRSRRRGGLSGPPLRARAIEVVARVRARLGAAMTVIGVGGIESAWRMSSRSRGRGRTWSSSIRGSFMAGRCCRTPSRGSWRRGWRRAELGRSRSLRARARDQEALKRLETLRPRHPQRLHHRHVRRRPSHPDRHPRARRRRDRAGDQGLRPTR